MGNRARISVHIRHTFYTFVEVCVHYREENEISSKNLSTQLTVRFVSISCFFVFSVMPHERAVNALHFENCRTSMQRSATERWRKLFTRQVGSRVDRAERIGSVGL